MKKKNLFKVFMLSLVAIGLFFVAPVWSQAEKIEISFELHNAEWIEYGTEWGAGNSFHVRDRLVKWTMVPVNPENLEMIKGFVFDWFNANYVFNNPNFYAKMWGKMRTETDEGGIWEGSFNGEVDRATGLQMGNAVCHGEGIYEGYKMHFYFMQRLGSLPTVFDCYGFILKPGGE